MDSETRNCQNCKKDFVIEPDDFSFYEKIKVPPPTFCPECRQQRRYAWRNERTLYRRNCDLCEKSTVTVYHPDSEFKVHCPHCWWGDDWNPKNYAQDYDFSKTFFEQWHELQKMVPRQALLTKNSINSEYVNHGMNNKNCYLGFDLVNCENTFYCSNCWDNLKDSCDCNMIFDKGILLYECIFCNRSYQCQYSLNTTDSMDCFYCYDCRNCQNCFLSSNLRNQKYFFKNKQYLKEEYFKLINKYKLDSYKERKELYKKWINLIRKESIHRFAIIEKSLNISGNVVYNSKNCQNVFDTFNSENSKNSVILDTVKESMDLFSVGWGVTENIYECHAVANSSNVFFSHLSYDNTFLEYCDSVHNSNNCFGCIGLKKSEYCILNKQYTKEEYYDLKNKIIKHMKKTKEYGEFFPAAISPFGYNETQGQIYTPISKEKSLTMGLKWQDNILGTTGKETILPKNIPDSIFNINEEILKNIFECIICKRNYNLILGELEFYKKNIIPIPRICYNCRYQKRIGLRLPRKLWHRACMKEGCKNEFETSYSPVRPEIVYCEKCYQQEVY